MAPTACKGQMPRLEILTTGGTIASKKSGPMASGDEVAGELSELLPYVRIDVREICRRGSSQITLDILWEIGNQVGKSFQGGATGVVVTHGTDTLEETAYFLDLIGEEFGPTVVTGAMRSLDAVAPEGLANLLESCKVALAPESRDYGVLVVMNDKVHLAREATKVHSWLLDAFSSPQCGPVGVVGTAAHLGVTYLTKPAKRAHTQYKGLVDPVDLIKAGIDSGDRMVNAALRSGTRGIVVESLGHGHLPPGMNAALRGAVSQGIPIVVTTRCLSGGSPNPGTLYESGFIATDLTGPKARVKLMLALSVSDEPAEIARMFSLHP